MMGYYTFMMGGYHPHVKFMAGVNPTLYETLHSHTITQKLKCGWENSARFC
jgi:hypothetical protein